MPLDKSTLLAAAEQIRRARQNGENTAERVGQMFCDIIDTLFGGIGSDQYLSRTRSDRSIGQVSSDKGFEVGQYTPGTSGAVVQVKEDGSTYAEVDELWVRVRAVFESLMVMESKVVGGRFYVTPGCGVRCSRVETLDDRYRCWFLAEQDGELSECRMEADDLARCERFSAAQGENGRVESRYYWRRVLAVNNTGETDAGVNRHGYIDLSIADCDSGSAVPAAGDEICHFGNVSADPASACRKTAIMISAVGPNAPCIQAYCDISGYSLADTEIVTIERRPSDGRIHVRLGRPGDSSYLDYTQDGGLELAGRFHLSSTVGDGGTTIGQTVVRTDVLFISVAGGGTPPLPSLAEDGSIADSKGWTTDAPAWAEGNCIWQCVYERRADTSARIVGPTNLSGTDGRGIARIEEQYYLSSSRTSLAGGSWQSTPPAWESGHYYWTRLVVTYTDGTYEYKDPVCVSGEQGESGTGAYRIDLSNEMAMVAADASGNVTGTYPQCQVTVWCGAERISVSGLRYLRTEGEGISTAWVDRSIGLFRTAAMTADTATVKVTAGLGDGNELVATMHIAKARPGQDGTDGKNGTDGQDGKDGADGKDGKDGLNGNDAVIYELVPTADAVTRNAEGELSAETVGCSVYKIVGPLRSLSDDHLLRYRLLPDGAWKSAQTTPLEGVYAGIAVTSGTSAVRFELYDTAGGEEIIYDRETVPVLTDASGFVCGENLLKNTNQGTKGWTPAIYAAGNPVTPLQLSAMQQRPFGVVLNNSNTYPYGYDASDSSTGVVTEVYYRLLFDLDSEFLLKADRRYTLAFDMEVNGRGLTYLTVGTAVNIAYGITDLGGGWVWSADLNGAETVRVEVPIKRSAALGNQRYLVITIGNRDVSEPVSGSAGRYKGEFYSARVSNLKLERGSMATPWSASPRETNYLMEALQQDTFMDGGLILTSLIKLGYADANGRWKVGAGINGMLSPSADDAVRKALILLWSGGDQIDAAVSLDSSDAATFLVRRDGSAYFCRNLIRFLEGRMEMGDNLFVDKTGLFLRDPGGNIYFKLTNQSVGDEAAMLEQSVSAVDSSATMQLRIHTAGSGGSGLQLSPGYYLVANSGTALHTYSVNGGSAVSSHGAALDIAVSSSFTYGSGDVNMTSHVKVTVAVEKQSGSSWVQTASRTLVFTTDGTSHSAGCALTASLEGGCRYRIRLLPSDSSLSPSAYGGTYAGAAVRITGRLVSGNNCTTLLGNDGLATAWAGPTLLMARGNTIVAQVNNVGIRVIKDSAGSRLQLRNGSAYYNFDFAKALSLGIITQA